MQKTGFKKIIFLLICSILCANGCKTVPKKGVILQDIQQKNNEISPLEDLEYNENHIPSLDGIDEEFSLPTDNPPAIWNTDDVDISHIDLTRKLIAFTFDDAPTRRLENIFAVYAAFNEQNPDCKASATFFFNGILFDNENIQLLHTALAMGFELGNHTFSHFDLTTLSETELKAEIEKTDEILRRADGKNYHLLRAPFGKINDTVKQISPTPLIDWTIDTVDWSGANAEEIYQTVTTQCFSGAIVLFHDGYPQTIEALKRLLPDLKEQGYQIVSVSQLAKAHGCTLQSGKVYIRARKQK